MRVIHGKSGNKGSKYLIFAIGKQGLFRLVNTPKQIYNYLPPWISLAISKSIVTPGFG